MKIPRIFTDEMFDVVFHGLNGELYTTVTMAANKAQSILEGCVKNSGRVLYDRTHDHSFSSWVPEPYEFSKHAGILLFVEPIKRECEHDPVPHLSTKDYSKRFYCRHCNVELNPTGWEVVNEK